MTVPVRLRSPDPAARRGEPVCLGLPWPKGTVRSVGQLRLVGPDGAPQVLQARDLDRWPDGSVRWALLDFLATTGAGDYRVEVAPGASAEPTDSGPGPAVLDTPTVRAEVGGPALLTAHPVGGAGPVEVVLGGSVPLPAVRAEVLDRGPVRWRAAFTSDPTADGLQVFGHVDLYAGTPVARVQLTVRNVRPADHPGGNWDLGNGGSVLIRDLTLTARLPGAGPAVVRCSPEPGEPGEAVVGATAEVYQDSSGGEHWRHTNHLNRDRVVPHRFRGYRLTTPDGVREGLRATPVVTAERGGRVVGAAVPRFWENFPKAVEAGPDGVTVGLFPRQSAAPHELQGGEQKTHVAYLAFGPDPVTDAPLAWCRAPLLAHADPEWYAATGAVPYLTPRATDPNAAYLALVDQAVAGPDSFFAKRELIDEYGWRNFGDVYADHEAVFHPTRGGLVSHYNNQFDVVRGCAVQFLRSADPRWWELLVPAADHTCDVDVYHTDADKPAYNGGLFWMTFHYADADTGTHRGYPRSLRAHTIPGRDLGALGQTGEALHRDVAAGRGGGPSPSHVYNQGLMLAYFLTGNPLYRETAVGLARYVLAADAPRALFRPLSAAHTGAATESRAGYHGPGRASGNSVLALLVGHQLTGDRAFLDKAEEVIRRASHPRQDLAALDLLNAELRWFYTMHLQAVGQYLDYKAELGELDRMYAYARLTLLHFARWMAANERPALDRPDELQYPTETWAAQDMRKVEVFQFAARHAAGEERARFLERAEWFFRYVERALSGFETKSLCRPVVLMLNFGWSRAWWQRHPDASAPEPAVAVSPEEFGEWRMFVPQKVRAIRRAKALASAALVAGVAGLLAVALYWVPLSP